LIEESRRWQHTALAVAAAALLAMPASQVYALSLGRVNVQSALGENLRAEIDVPELNAEEAASLHAVAASPTAYAAAGLEYNPAMGGLQVTLARHADGRAFLRLSTDRAINDPFVDLILEATWSSGRIVRDYTMLFDPPPSAPAAPNPTLAQTTPAKSPASAPSAPDAPPSDSSRGGKSASADAAMPMSPSSEAHGTHKQARQAQASDTRQLTVKSGDTASKIALNNKPDDVSLDQMLVAMLRTNPDAFSKGNLNRLLAGAVLELPSAEEAKTVSPEEASQMVVAQSKDFDAYRRSLAENAPRSNAEAPNRKATGNVETRVQDQQATSPAPDKLTLSKGAVQAKTDEARIARERNAREAAERSAELAKNISDLSKLQAAATTAAPMAAAPMASASSMGDASSMASSTAPAASSGIMASGPAISASTSLAPAAAAIPAPAASMPPTPKPAASAPMEPPAEPGLIDQVLENPVLMGIGAAIVLIIIGGVAFFRRRKAGKKNDTLNDSVLDSRQAGDTFVDTSGGQQVDTTVAIDDDNGYANSQLEAADDVDPVAEADVYLAYGRDQQAEDILKEALRQTPTRIALHTKLLEIYAKRQDTANFETTARQALELTQKNSSDGSHICTMGRGIDPNNPLYQEAKDDAPPAAATPEEPTGAGPLDLDLDFSADDEPVSVTTPVSSPSDAKAPEPKPTPMADAMAGLDFDLDLPSTPAPRSQPAAAPEPAMPAPMATPAPATAATAADESLEFDLSSLSLDLDEGVDSIFSETNAGSSSHDTKLALAEEFVSIGDHDGARALIEEVIAEADGPVLEKAHKALASLN